MKALAELMWLGGRCKAPITVDPAEEALDLPSAVGARRSRLDGDFPDDFDGDAVTVLTRS